jgi:thiol-disulfide isomerase/thioredoxin
VKLTKKAAIVLLVPFLLSAPKVTTVSFEQLQQQAEDKHNDTLYVVNFWATWCDPCVKELPDFQQAYQNFKSKKVKFIFVSLNSPKEFDKVQKFATDKQLVPEVLLLNGGNPNNWIDKIDSSWSGAIPATVIYKDGKKVYFHEGDLTLDKLTQVIKSKNK